MTNIKQILEEKEFLNTLHSMAEAYEELSVMRMQKIRDSVIKTRLVLEKLSDIYAFIQASKESAQSKENTRSKERNLINTHQQNLIKKNQKTITVLLTANTKLYGDLFSKVFSLFINSIKNYETDIVIIGKIGKEMMNNYGMHNYKYFEIPDSEVKANDLKPIFDYIKIYEKVILCYGKFINMAIQQPTLTQITGEDILKTQNKKNIKNKKIEAYLFEPSFNEVLYFFETQIYVSLFKQIIQEAELARLASRIKAMESSLDNVNKKLKNNRLAILRAKRSIKQVEQMEKIYSLLGTKNAK